MTTPTTKTKTTPEAKPAADVPQTGAQTAPPASPSLVNKIFGPVKKMLGGS